MQVHKLQVSLDASVKAADELKAEIKQLRQANEEKTLELGKMTASACTLASFSVASPVTIRQISIPALSNAALAEIKQLRQANEEKTLELGKIAAILEQN
jgi:uncharacterized protein with ACT and thioredoxin-like domain